MTFRKVLFWTHLVAGLVAGLSILVMCFTGTALAFEKQLVRFAERDVRRVDVPAGAVRQSLRDLQRSLHAAAPDAAPTAIVVSADPADAVIFQAGRDAAYYANPYTGAIATPSTTRMHDFMQVMEDWHRWLALGGDQRAIGKAINGACNAAFFVLAVTGLYLWLPRTWSWRGVRAVALFNWRLTGKARDFNWHNAIGLWSAPVLIVLTLTALPMSYRWANNLVYTLAGETAPAGRGPGGFGGGETTVAPPAAGARPLAPDALLAAAQQAYPDWEQLTLRTGAANARRGPGRERSAETARAGGGGERERASGDERRERSAGAAAAGIVVKTPGGWPRTATTTLTLNPYTAEVMQTESFADLSAGRRFRTWTRFLHTGEALGWIGQLVAGLACLGGCFLVYTGIALAWRRFFPRRRATS